MSLGLFAIPVVLILATMLAPRFSASPRVEIHVTDRYNGQQIAGAEVVTSGAGITTDANGAVVLALLDEPTELQIRAPGYEAVTATLTSEAPPEWQVALRPNMLSGRLTDAATGAGIADVAVSVVAPGSPELSATTDADGQYTIDGVPEGATVRFVSADYGVVEEPVEQQTSLDLAMQPSFVKGTVTDATGAPLAGARVAAANGSAEVFAGADGVFHLTGGTDVQEVTVSAPGFASQSFAVDASRQVSAQLDGEMIKAVYANLGVLGDAERWNELIEIADTTEINAIVIDVKQDTIYYDTQVPFYRDIDGMITPIFDPKTLLAELDAHGIY
ncbi:MAG TPA: carboxypeptidase regulatory-like domain-containing protein, partial [Burkholderiaceae bacterium]|nr:carboxypeptidase regulatory-like domain-containing protein [Burkholderiaceae bacterium]